MGSIALIGPGGAGKTTIGALVAERLGIEFVDLDRCFTDRIGDISEYLDHFGYEAYARENVETYCSLSRNVTASRVLALSSGFMTYPRNVHPEYAQRRMELEHSPSTFVLVPSLDPERCVAETVRRQLTRPFRRSSSGEEAVIRERLPIYVGLLARKIETMRPLAAVVDELLTSIEG
jgi:shikimate kinase